MLARSMPQSEVLFRDSLDAEKVAELQAESIYALQAYSIESLYYCQPSMMAVAEWQAKSLNHNANEKVEEAKNKALQVLKTTGITERMSARLCERIVGNRLASRRPDWKQIRNGKIDPIEVDVDAQSIYSEELTRFRALIDDSNLHELIRRYPLRESNVFQEIAYIFQIPKVNYEKTLISRVKADETLAGKLRELIQPLSDKLNQEQP